MRLIDVDAFIEYAKERLDICADDLISMINEQPTVEAKPIVHGEWTHTGYADEFECSNCKIQMALSDDENAHPNFCPNCGARMDGKKVE